MVKLTKETAFKAPSPRSETPIDKTTRIVREIIEEEGTQRKLKMERLRRSRLEREACTPAKPTAAAHKTALKTVSAKAAAKR